MVGVEGLNPRLPAPKADRRFSSLAINPFILIGSSDYDCVEQPTVDDFVDGQYYLVAHP